MKDAGKLLLYFAGILYLDSSAKPVVSRSECVIASVFYLFKTNVGELGATNWTFLNVVNSLF